MYINTFKEKLILNESLTIKNDLFTQVKTDILNSNDFRSFSEKAVKYEKSEIEKVEDFLGFLVLPENNHKRKGREILYHGSPDDIEKFTLTKGLRSASFGGNREVDNLGVFLTDNKKLADFFGNNRAEGKNKYTSNLYTLFVDLGRVLDYNNLPPNLTKIAHVELTHYHGKRQKISPTNFWWLLDNEEFIDEVKKSYDTVIFDEQKKVLKMANVSSGKTYFILNPNKIEKYEPLTFEELKSNIDFYMKNYLS